MLNIYTYHIPFTKAFKTGTAVYRQRKGILLEYNHSFGSVWSEAAPLPGFSTESFGEVSSFFVSMSEQLSIFYSKSYSLNELRNFLHQLPPIPTVQFSLSWLGLIILSQRAQKAPDKFFTQKFNQTVFVNDVIGFSDPESILKQMRSSAQHGFRTIKIKVNNSLNGIPALLNRIHLEFPNLNFRLDANRSLPFESIEEFTSLFRHVPIEYIEEPCWVHTKKERTEMIKKSTIPIAFDESINDFNELKNLLLDVPESFVVIKPSLYGNLFDLIETISDNRSSGDRVVVSTLLESKTGRIMTAFIAGLIGDKTLSHGLHTGRFLDESTTRRQKIKNGQLKIDLSDFSSWEQPLHTKHLTKLISSNK